MLKRRSTECEGGPRARCRRVDTARPRRDAGRAGTRGGVGAGRVGIGARGGGYFFISNLDLVDLNEPQ